MAQKKPKDLNTIDVEAETTEQTVIPLDDLKSVLTEVNESAKANSSNNQNKANTDSSSGNDSDDWSNCDLDSLEPYTAYWRDELSYPENIQVLINRLVLLPEQDVLTKVITTYAINNSVGCNWLPMLLFWGESGTGKSQLYKLIAGIRGQNKSPNTMRSGETTTFAGMRNIINDHKWKYPDLQPKEERYERNNEKPIMLFLADCKESIFGDEMKYACFRNGVDRKEQIISISKGDGTNLDFYTFSPKVLTTADDFFMQNKYAEALRRMIIIPTWHLNNYPKEVREPFLEEQIDADYIDFSGIETLYNQHWNKERRDQFNKLNKQHGNWKKACVQLGFTQHQFIASFDLMRTCYASGITKSPKETFELFLAYWQFYAKVVTGVQSGLHTALEGILEPYIKPYLDDLATYKEIFPDREPPKLQINAKLVKDAIQTSLRDGAMFTSNQENWASALKDLGFALKNSSKGMVWEYKKT